MHPTKTKIAYCKDKKRKGTYPNVKFDFLGYCFRPRLVKRFRDNTLFCGFNPAVSSSAMKAMRLAIRELKLNHQTQLSLQDIARQLNPLLRGWIEYYGRYAPSALYPLLRHVNRTLIAWAMRKFKRFKDHKVRASQFLQRLATEHRSLFVHWDIGMTGDGSWMRREVHVQFCERPRAKLPGPTLPGRKELPDNASKNVARRGILRNNERNNIRQSQVPRA
jgi:RNA-directed DNA polymerase